MSEVYWTPWAARWFKDAARRRELELSYAVRKVKVALRTVKWRGRKRLEDPEYFARAYNGVRARRAARGVREQGVK